MFFETADYTQNPEAGGGILLTISGAETIIDFKDLSLGDQDSITPNPGEPNQSKVQSVTGLTVTPLEGGDGGFRFTVDRSTLDPTAQSFVIVVNNRPIMHPVNFDGANTKTIDYPFVDAEEEYTFKVVFYDGSGGSSSEVTITALDGLGEIKATNQQSLSITVNTSQGYVQMNSAPQLPALISPYAGFEYYLRMESGYSGVSGDYGPTDKVPLACFMQYGGSYYQGQSCFMTMECGVRYGKDGEEVEYEGTIAESEPFTMPAVTATTLSGTVTVNNAPANLRSIYISPRISFDDKLWSVGDYSVTTTPGSWSGQVWSVGTHDITNFRVYVETNDGKKQRFIIPLDSPLSVSSSGGTYSNIALTVDYNGS
jgi:hypothetical protein